MVRLGQKVAAPSPHPSSAQPHPTLPSQLQLLRMSPGTAAHAHAFAPTPSLNAVDTSRLYPAKGLRRAHTRWWRRPSPPP